jgi:hypothetical protein
MIKLYSPRNEVELAIIKSILESEEVPFFVHNDNYGSLIIGPRIGLLNAKTIFVPENALEKARELIAEYLKNTAEETEIEGGERSEYSIADKIRIVIESLIFGWFMPGKRWRKKPRNKS